MNHQSKLDGTHKEAESKRMWSRFWENQADSRALVHRLIRLGRFYFSRIYASFIRKHCPSASVLDAGCGSAESTLLLARMAKQATEVMGLDFAPQSMVLARRNARRYGVEAAFVVGDINFMPLKSNCFDLVWNMGVLEHLENPISVIGEMKRVTRKGGKIVAIVPFRYTPLIYVAAVLKAFEKVSKRFKIVTWEETAWLWSRKQLQQKFREVGLKQVKVHLMFESFLFDMAVVGEKAES